MMTLAMLCLVVSRQLLRQSGKKAHCPGNIYYVHHGMGEEEEQAIY